MIRRLLGAAMALALLAVPACGGDDDDDAAGATSTTAAPEPVEGEAFSDPQGSYTLTVPPGWKAQPGTMVAEIELWTVGEPVDSFAPNVNVLTQAAPGLNLEQYLDASVKSLQEAKGKVTEQKVVTGAAGQQLGVMRYTTEEQESLKFLGVFSVKDGRAVAATFTATAGRFDTALPEVEPYLLTLQAA